MQIRDSRLSVRRIVETAGQPYTAARYEPRASLFFQGGDADSVMYVESGRVELAALASSGREAICGLLGTGAFLGEEGLSGSGARSHTATALVTTDVLIFSKPAVSELLATTPAFAERFIEHCVSSAARLRDDLAGQLLYSCEARLARVLLSLAGPGDGGAHGYALPNVTQEFIARMVGTTRSRVNHFLGKFKRMGFVVERGGQLRLNPALAGAVPGLSGSIPVVGAYRELDAERYQ